MDVDAEIEVEVEGATGMDAGEEGAGEELGVDNVKEIFEWERELEDLWDLAKYS